MIDLIALYSIRAHYVRCNICTFVLRERGGLVVKTDDIGD